MSDWKSDWCTACPIGNPIRRSALLCAVLSRPSCPSSDCVADHMSAGPNQCTKITTILLTMQIDVFIVLLLRPELQHVCTTRIPQDPGQNAQRRCWGGRHSSHELVTLAEGVVKPRASATYLLVGCVLEFKGQLGYRERSAVAPRAPTDRGCSLGAQRPPPGHGAEIAECVEGCSVTE
jgi:hypothetical protein